MNEIVCIRKEPGITIGKKYIYLKEIHLNEYNNFDNNSNFYYIIDDTNQKNYYYSSSFKTLKEYRKEKINFLEKRTISD